MTRTEVDYSEVESMGTPQEYAGVGYDELVELHKEAIAREHSIQRAVIDNADSSRSKISQVVCKVSDNTAAGLAFEKGVAMLQTLELFGVIDQYMDPDTMVEMSGDNWKATFARPGNKGVFSVVYVAEHMNGEPTHTQKLLYTARSA